ncbi:MAG TPA: hypothetical protein VG294_01600 [Solirubrobacteraceae bacterium]|nr:hypothetical protein [Solirubrobacteraceae bacterium]
MAALFQLSYSPDEVEVIGKVNACPLAVAGRGQAEVNEVGAGETLCGEQKRPIELAAVDGEQIDLVDAVGPADVTVAGTPRAAQVYRHDVPSFAQTAPLDLHAPQAAANVKREIGPPMLGHRLQHGNALLGSREHDRHLRHRALAVAVAEVVRQIVQHEHMFASAPDRTSRLTPAE